MRLFIVDPNTGPIAGIVIKMTAPNGRPYYTGETDSLGYAEVLVPVGQRYGIEYLSLGRQTTTATPRARASRSPATPTTSETPRETRRRPRGARRPSATTCVSHGIDSDRVEAVGYGDQRPVASNDTEGGRRQNRRIEAVEL